MLFRAVDDSNATDFCWLQSLFGESNRILVEFDDVDFLPAQFADDRLYAHALHANAGTNGVNVSIFRHHRDLGALAGFPRDGTDHDRAVVNFRNFSLE